MEGIIYVISIAVAVILGSYFVSRAVTKGILRELDLYLGNKFVNYVNTKKRKEDGNKEEK